MATMTKTRDKAPKPAKKAERTAKVANAVAPEHLELMTADPEALVGMVRNAGAVFCGAYSPASVGDYLAGPSHVLPTYRSARFASGLRVDDFSKYIHLISLDQPALARIAPHVAAIAEAEGLAAHAASVGRFARTSMISASLTISPRRSRWKSAQPSLTMSGTCR